uniref:Carboxymuconolactone decarboxylase-like domain-containing protein n=1 Tax=Aplanochytrium stocchinoi TaxID=215587 RepID=A0A6S8DY55_9STRA
MAPRVEYIEVRDMVPELKSRFNSGKQLNIFKAIANHPELANSWLKFADHVVGKTQTLPPRDRELVILRIGWLCQSDYEFGQHVRIGLRTGVKEDEIKKLTVIVRLLEYL